MGGSTHFWKIRLKLRVRRQAPMTQKAGAVAFSWPPHYEFPPFFSKQPNRDTDSRRVQLWKDLILGYCAHHRLFSLNVREALASSPLFYNEKISRRLRPEVSAPE
jgi:ESCRT-II complex subunit VPS25